MVRRGDFLSQSVDLAVVGAGILGLAVAREALLRHSGLRARVFEKEPQIATHQTGHNSGVIHAGVYYPPGSLKARLCVQGSREIYEYCDEHGISYERCGKVVVATSEDELPRLAEIHRRARANAVPGIELLDAAALAEIEPHVVGLRALHSPATGIVDFRRVANALADDVARLGGELCLNATIVGVEAGPRGVELQTQGETWRAKTVITCAGVYSDRLARMTGAPVAPKIVPFRGRYYSLRQGARSLVHGLVYPVPDPAFPFLGVHFTKQISGDVWTGPNAVLALSLRVTGHAISTFGISGKPSRIQDSARSPRNTGAPASPSCGPTFPSARSPLRCSGSCRQCTLMT